MGPPGLRGPIGMQGSRGDRGIQGPMGQRGTQGKIQVCMPENTNVLSDLHSYCTTAYQDNKDHLELWDLQDPGGPWAFRECKGLLGKQGHEVRPMYVFVDASYILHRLLVREHTGPNLKHIWMVYAKVMGHMLLTLQLCGHKIVCQLAENLEIQ